MNSSQQSEVNVLPWHEDHWERLNHQISSDRLPHALLVAGPSRSGKSLIVDALVLRLLCREPDGPCGQCHQCQLVAAETHPDLLHVSLEDSKQILIGQIRDLIEWATQTSQQGGWKVCIVNPADKMNIQSSNALLKSLEEPPGRTCIILVTEQPNRLLPTLRSRCQRVDCHQPDRNEAVRWLQAQRPDVRDADLLLDIAGGVPLRAAEYISDEYLALRALLASKLPALLEGEESPIQMAASLSKADPAEVMDILFQLATDAVGYSLSANSVCRNSDLSSEIDELAKRAGNDACFRLIDRLNEAKRIMAGTSNANAQMVLEWLLMDDT